MLDGSTYQYLRMFRTPQIVEYMPGIWRCFSPPWIPSVVVRKYLVGHLCVISCGDVYTYVPLFFRFFFVHPIWLRCFTSRCCMRRRMFSRHLWCFRVIRAPLSHTRSARGACLLWLVRQSTALQAADFLFMALSWLDVLRFLQRTDYMCYHSE